jgi:hypothetical protein
MIWSSAAATASSTSRTGKTCFPPAGSTQKDSRGKSGSFRYIYLYLEHRGRIFLLLLFSKNEHGNLSPEQVKQVAAAVEKMKEANKD